MLMGLMVVGQLIAVPAVANSAPSKESVEVKKYDFYNPHNIFVLENNNEADLPAFLNTPYQEIPENIRQKYSFTNWIHYVLSIDPYTPITVPNK